MPEHGFHLATGGRELLRRMWPIYGGAIAEHFAQHYNKAELKQLAGLLGRLPDVAR